MTNNWPLLAQLKTFINENWKSANFQQPTPVQEEAIPEILSGKDVIAESPTGSGKTLAYILPILEKIEEENKGLQAVILVPSRELAMQILEEIRKFTKGTTIKGAAFIGGANIKKQVEKLKEKPKIAVGTPGRVMELINIKKMKMHQVKTIVIDEADQLLGQEHMKSIDAIIKSTLKERQLLFFSATISEETEKKAKLLSEQLVKVSIKQNQQPINIDHFFIQSEQREKVDLVRKIMHTNPGKTIVFIKNNELVEEVAIKLNYHSLPVAVLGSELNKLNRKQALTDFRTGKVQLLITSDVAARGIDIEDVKLIIHYDFPSTSAQYLHRSGRTGRMGKEGTVISLVNAKEQSFLKKMANELNITMKQKRLARGKIMDI